MEDITPVPLPDDLMEIWIDLEETRTKQTFDKENLVGMPHSSDEQTILQIADQIVHQYIYGDSEVAKITTKRLEKLGYKVSWDPKFRLLAVSI